MTRPGRSPRTSLLACTCLVAGFALAVLTGTAAAQTSSAASNAEAMILRDRGDLAGAVAILRARLADHPDDGDAARLLAQTLYWLGERAEARALYEAALVRHPGDTAVRLEYGRMLVDLLDARRARTLLLPLTASGTARASAATLLGTLDYWTGNLSGAMSWLETALDADSARRDTRELLREIAGLTAPWLRVSVSGRRDDQPLREQRGEVEVGWFPVPEWSLAVRAAPSRFPADAITTREALDLSARARGFVPAMRLRLEGEGGVYRRSWARSGDWTGRGAAALGLGRSFALGASLHRAPYLHTQSSLRSAVMSTAIGANLRLDSPRGWLGELAIQREDFPDDNTISTAFGWILAPLVHGPRGHLLAGYSLSMQDSRESRFVLVDTTPSLPPGRPQAELRGRYDPYFTPDQLTAHAVIASLMMRPSRATALRLGGSYGVRAHDRAPVFLSVPSVPPQGEGVVRASYARTYTPWDIRASFEAGAPGGSSLRITGAHNHTIFYSASSLAVAVTLRRITRLRNSDRR